jgi:hypothetical protein
MSVKKMKAAELVEQLAAQAREYHRTGDVVRRNQCEESIREVAPRRLAEKVIAGLYATQPTISSIELYHDSGSCDYWIVALSDERFAFVWGNWEVKEGSPLLWEKLGGVVLEDLGEIEGDSTDERGLSVHDDFREACEAWKSCAAAMDQCRQPEDPQYGVMWQMGADAATDE